MITEPAQADIRNVHRKVHPNCVVCGRSNDRGLQLQFEQLADGTVQARFACDRAFEGYQGTLHGGVIASLLDGAMTHCMFTRGTPAVTAELTVRFRHPVVAGSAATVRAWIDRSLAPLHVLKSELIQNGQVKATGSGKFMERPGPSEVRQSFS